ncbi:MAG: winged helix-turn-helix transcriptional regulator [Burkholderiales bacterium]|nr:winged helix-turn-helix transcriptional regulator [Burkholderiales bacterium]
MPTARRAPPEARAAAPPKARAAAPPTARAAVPPAQRSRDVNPFSDPQVMAVLEEFRLIFKSVRRHFQAVEAHTGVSGAQAWLLAEVRARPGIRVTELAQVMAIHQTTASNLVERLARRGKIERRRSEDDHRAVHLHLTAAGRSLVARAPGPVQGVLPAALKQLPSEELAELRRRLARLTRLLPLRDARGRKTPLSEI